MKTLGGKNTAAVVMGRRGGKAGRGASKRRTPEQTRAAAAARWGMKRGTGDISAKASEATRSAWAQAQD